MWRASAIALGLLTAPALAGGGGPAGTVLILDTTVSGGMGSLEAQCAISSGYSVELVDAAGWMAKTTADFATYDALILGDPHCLVGTGAVAAAEATVSVWGPAVSGNVLIVGTDPEWHQSSGGAQLTCLGIDFVTSGFSSGGTGAYITLSCYYHDTTPLTPVAVLDAFSPGGFTVKGVGCFNDSHIVATHPAMSGLTDANLSNWSCSVHEAFDNWPDTGIGAFTVLAIAENAGGEYNAPDGTVGTPYILARGAQVISDISLDPATTLGILVGTQKTLTATVSESGSPVVGTTVTFDVVAGPMTGLQSMSATDGAGQATFTYTSTGPGVDTVRATFINGASLLQTSNNAICDWQSIVQLCPGVGCPCGNDDPGAGCVNSTGSGALLSITGSTSASADDMVMTVTNARPNGFCLMYMGPSPDCVALGDGLRGVSPGPLGMGYLRFAVQSADGAGTFGEGPGMTAYSTTHFGAGSIVAGQSFYFQGFYRDPVTGPCGNHFNFSNAAGVHFTP